MCGEISSDYLGRIKANYMGGTVGELRNDYLQMSGRVSGTYMAVMKGILDQLPERDIEDSENLLDLVNESR